MPKGKGASDAFGNDAAWDVGLNESNTVDLPARASTEEKVEVKKKFSDKDRKRPKISLTLGAELLTLLDTEVVRLKDLGFNASRSSIISEAVFSHLKGKKQDGSTE